MLGALRDSEGRIGVDSNGSRISASELVTRVLQSLGPPIVPALTQALKDSAGEKKAWRRYGCRVLGRSGSKEAVPPLATLIDDGFLCVRLEAFHALGTLGPEAKEAVPALTRALEAPEGQIRGWAGEALKKVLGDR